MRTHHISLIEGPTGYEFSLAPRVSKMIRLLKDQGALSVLDVGCGTGRHSRYLAHYAFTVYALDICHETLTPLTRPVNRDQPGHLYPVMASMTSLPFQTASLDAICCFSTIHHNRFSDIVMTLREFARVLRPGRLLCLDILSRNDPSYGRGSLLEPHTFIGSRSGEDNIPHHYTSHKDITRALSAFTLHTLEEVRYTFDIQQPEDAVSVVFDIIARKPLFSTRQAGLSKAKLKAV
jgi:ubiquinone/menaquinone biosynthesis C-methylase UbiE